MTAYRVVIPEESYSIIGFRQEDLPGVGAVNTALREFEPKIVFSWHLSLMMQLDELIENGMPSRAEREVVDRFGDSLDAALDAVPVDRPRPFDFRMDHDPNWELARWHLAENAPRHSAIDCLA